MTVTSNSSINQPNSSSKKVHFRVNIKQAEDWKVRAIADYKRRQEEKRQKQNNLSASGKVSSVPIVPHSNNDKKSVKKSKVSDSTEQSINSESHAKIDAGLLARQQQQQQHQQEVWIRELEIIAQNGAASKERVKQLHLARSQLLWLLKKAARHERHMVHEHLSLFATENS